MSVKIKADIRHWLRELDKKYFCVMLGFAVMVYFPLISQRLVNTFDGLWNGSWFIGGFWELSIGRWLWCVADAVRFGVQTEPLNALLTLSMMVLGITLLRRLFVERDNALTREWLPFPAQQLACSFLTAICHRSLACPFCLPCLQHTG